MGVEKRGAYVVLVPKNIKRDQGRPSSPSRCQTLVERLLHGPSEQWKRAFGGRLSSCALATLRHAIASCVVDFWETTIRAGGVPMPGVFVIRHSPAMNTISTLYAATDAYKEARLGALAVLAGYEDQEAGGIVVHVRACAQDDVDTCDDESAAKLAEEGLWFLMPEKASALFTRDLYTQLRPGSSTAAIKQTSMENLATDAVLELTSMSLRGPGPSSSTLVGRVLSTGDATWRTLSGAADGVSVRRLPLRAAQAVIRVWQDRNSIKKEVFRQLLRAARVQAEAQQDDDDDLQSHRWHHFYDVLLPALDENPRVSAALGFVEDCLDEGIVVPSGILERVVESRDPSDIFIMRFRMLSSSEALWFASAAQDSAICSADELSSFGPTALKRS